jgi:hypothetical protein
MAISFIGGRSRSPRRESPTMDKQLVNFISCALFVIYKAGSEPTPYKVTYSTYKVQVYLYIADICQCWWETPSNNTVRWICFVNDFIVLNATFNNISAISRRPVLAVANEFTVVKELQLKLFRQLLPCCKAAVTFKDNIYQRKIQC